MQDYYRFEACLWQDAWAYVKGIETFYREYKEDGFGVEVETVLHSDPDCPVGKLIDVYDLIWGRCSWAEKCQWCLENGPKFPN